MSARLGEVVQVAVDDLDGHPGHDVRMVLFGLDGVVFEIRLGAANAARLRAVLDRFVRAARRVPVTAAMPLNSVDAGLAQVVRQWARACGYRVCDRGRISSIVLNAYARAHPDGVGAVAGNARGDHPKRLVVHDSP